MKLDGAWEKLFWGVFQRSSNPIAVLDDRQRIAAVNDAGLDLLGGRRLQLLGSTMPDYFTPETRRRGEDAWQKVLRSGENVGSQRLRRDDGTELDVDYVSRLIRIPPRAFVLVVVLPATQPRFHRSPMSTEEGRLTRREREVVGLVALGLETPAIAMKLHISEHTVRAHVRNAMKRLSAQTRAHLVAIALCGPPRPSEDGQARKHD